MMIQDIGPHVYHNEYHPEAPEDDSFLLYYEKGMVLLSRDRDGEIDYPRFRDLDDGDDVDLDDSDDGELDDGDDVDLDDGDDGELDDGDDGVNGKSGRKTMEETSRFLFKIDGTGYFLTEIRPRLKETAAANFHLGKIAVFRQARPKHQSFAGITGYQLWDWYLSNQFCGRCGHTLRHADNERMMFCEECENTIYPRISPAVIVGVLDGDRILMTKYSGRDYKRYALIAGFNEIGESVEDTVRREVMEEVGLKVKNIRYYKSQPWSFSETLLLGFYCDLDGDDTIRLDTDELSVGEWIRREDIPETVDWLSLTNEMIVRFQKGLEQG